MREIGISDVVGILVQGGLLIVFAVFVIVNLSRIHNSIDAQTAALERIADELKPPLHSETTITHIDPVVCDTLGNALKTTKGQGRHNDAK